MASVSFKFVEQSAIEVHFHRKLRERVHDGRARGTCRVPKENAFAVDRHQRGGPVGQHHQNRKEAWPSVAPREKVLREPALKEDVSSEEPAHLDLRYAGSYLTVSKVS